MFSIWFKVGQRDVVFIGISLLKGIISMDTGDITAIDRPGMSSPKEIPHHLRIYMQH